MDARQTCPRCDKRGMKSWSDLTEEQREVVKRLPDPNHVTAHDVANRMGFSSVADLHQTLTEQMEAIRESYNRIL